MTDNYLEYVPTAELDHCVLCNDRLVDGVRVVQVGTDTTGQPVYEHVACREQHGAMLGQLVEA